MKFRINGIEIDTDKIVTSISFNINYEGKNSEIVEVKVPVSANNTNDDNKIIKGSCFDKDENY